MKQKRPRAGRREFLRTSTAAGMGMAVAQSGSSPRDLRLGQVRIIDLSVSIEHDAAGEMTKPRIEYVTHDAGGLKGMMDTFGAKSQDFVYSNGHGWAVENLTVGSHTATHIDAPYHYGATSEGKPARRIDEVPLEWCFGPGVVLDMRHRKPGEVISVADLQQRLREIGHTLSPSDIVLIHTGAATRWGLRNTFDSRAWIARARCGWSSRASTSSASTRGRSIGEFAAQIADYKRTGDGRYIWPAHFAGITKEYCQIEKLANLDQIPQPHGFFVSCLPVKIKGGSAGWCRAVALVPR